MRKLNISAEEYAVYMRKQNICYEMAEIEADIVEAKQKLAVLNQEHTDICTQERALQRSSLCKEALKSLEK